MTGTMTAANGFPNGTHNGGGVGSFLGVCAPYSSARYSDNWRFTRVKGAQVSRSLDSLGGQVGWGSFDEYTARVYEERFNGDEAMIRPPSTKVCPPNYVLRGIGLALSEDFMYYAGVTNLYCTKPASSSSPGPQDLVVPLDTAQISGAFDYTMAGKPFPLSQNIGLPVCGRGCGSVACASGAVMVGFRSAHDSVGRMNYFEPQCMVSP